MEWVTKTNAIGLKATTGSCGGTYAHSDLAWGKGGLSGVKLSLKYVFQNIFVNCEKNSDMTTLEIKRRLINKIKKTEDNNLLEEAFRLFEIESEDFVEYELNDSQIQAISEAREQIKSGKYLSADEADKEIDQWLNK